MKHYILFFGFVLFFSIMVKAQKVENVRAQKFENKVNILYYISNSNPDQRFIVTISCSKAEGEKFVLKSVTGDVGANVIGGKREYIATWDVLKDTDQLLNAEFFVKVEFIPQKIIQTDIVDNQTDNQNQNYNNNDNQNQNQNQNNSNKNKTSIFNQRISLSLVPLDIDLPEIRIPKVENPDIEAMKLELQLQKEEINRQKEELLKYKSQKRENGQDENSYNPSRTTFYMLYNRGMEYTPIGLRMGFKGKFGMYAQARFGSGQQDEIFGSEDKLAYSVGGGFSKLISAKNRHSFHVYLGCGYGEWGNYTEWTETNFFGTVSKQNITYQNHGVNFEYGLYFFTKKLGFALGVSHLLNKKSDKELNLGLGFNF